MSIIEFIINCINNICYSILRFPYWIITARDCRHCKNSKSNFLISGDTLYCGKGWQSEIECKHTIKRKYFEKQ